MNDMLKAAEDIRQTNQAIDKQDIKITNPKAYKIPAGKTVKITVEVAKDMVPGWGYEIEDHIQFIFQNPYVQSITIAKDLVIDTVEEN